MALTPKNRPKRVVVFIQENKTTDFYFPTLAEWGADVVNSGQLLSDAPDFDQPHDRNSWVHYKMGDYPAARFQVNNDTVIPFYSWLAKEFTFCDHHFGLGTNSTPGHMLAIGGQTPTLRNPSSTQAPPLWDLPTIFKHVERAGSPGAHSRTTTGTRCSSTLSSPTPRARRASTARRRLTIRSPTWPPRGAFRSFPMSGARAASTSIRPTSPTRSMPSAATTSSGSASMRP